MRIIRYHDEARLKLVHKVAFYSAVNPSLGERFDTAVQAAAERAAQFPSLGSPYSFGSRRVFPEKFPFSVVYLATEEEIFIVAITAFSRKPGYWRRRRNDG